MLILTRKSGESLCIDGEIRITVMRVRGNRVKIGVDAPTNTLVLRGELRATGMECPRENAVRVRTLD